MNRIQTKINEELSYITADESILENALANKKPLRFIKKPFLAAAIPVLALCAVLAVLIFWRNPKDLTVYGGLDTGKYMHNSGNPNHYIMVYEDDTLQVFGLDFVEYTMRENANRTDIELTDDFINMVRESAKQSGELMAERNLYYADANDFWAGKTFKDGGGHTFKITVIDKHTLQLYASDELVYVYDNGD